jgi:guanylate kinase
MSKYKRIIVAGKGGSGKDHLVKLLKDRGFIYSVSHTSRPPREGEIDGLDYYFVSYDEANEMSISGKFYECVIFNNWFYGTSLDEFYRANLFIMTPSGIGKLKPEDREQSLVVYIDIDRETRRSRLSNRRDSDNAERRIKADDIDFSDFCDYDIRIEDPNFSIDEVLEKIKNISPKIFPFKPTNPLN